jgi:hypothetical protein
LFFVFSDDYDEAASSSSLFLTLLSLSLFNYYSHPSLKMIIFHPSESCLEILSLDSRLQSEEAFH